MENTVTQIKIINNPDPEQWDEVLARPVIAVDTLFDKVEAIFKEIEGRGQPALLEYTRLFDDVALESLKVPALQLEQAGERLPDSLKKAILLAYKNINTFHNAQKNKGNVEVQTSPGVQCWQQKKPIEKVGLYIPGGSAPLFSTVLMLAIPAQLANCKEIVMCSPPGKDKNLHPALLYAAHLCGIKQVFMLGGAQAIAAMSLGAGEIPQVYKIFGPGNQYVTAAKLFATRYKVAIDMPAGPSEVMVVADESANPEFIAADLLSQAEHGADSQVILLSESIEVLRQSKAQLLQQVEELNRRTTILQALRHCRFILLKNKETLAAMINHYGPEHLIICCKDEAYYLEMLQNAGSVFLGNYSAESLGDYVTGTNHTLPTNGLARSYSGVGLDSFMKNISFQRVNAEGLKKTGWAAEIMAEAEGLEAHQKAVSRRLKTLDI